MRRWVLPALALLGLGVAAYLSWQKLSGGPIICLGGSAACDRVNASPYAQVAGVPVAYLGAAMYLGLLALGVLAASGRPGARTALVAAWGASLTGVLFSAYLTFVELFILRDVCQWCVASAVIMAAYCAVSTWQVLTPQPA